MGDLRDQLKKAKLLSKKDAKRIAHEERVHRKQKGGAKAIDAENALHQAELQHKRDAQRAHDRAQQAQVQAAKDQQAEVAACEQLLAREVRKPGRGGAVRWYFATPDGALPFLELPHLERAQLAERTLSVVRVGPPGSHDYGLLEAAHAERVAKVFPERVVYGVKSGSEEYLTPP